MNFDLQLMGQLLHATCMLLFSEFNELKTELSDFLKGFAQQGKVGEYD